MKTFLKKPKVLAVVGPTASGKSDLAVRLAKQFDGEVVSVDSRQVYRGLDIGTGKVTKAEMRGVPHHLLDIANPKRAQTAAQFTHKGRRAINDILKRGKLPILAGGTGFYLSALLGEISLPEVPPQNALRKELAENSNEQLLQRLAEPDPERAGTIDQHNTVRLIRAIEVAEAIGKTPPNKSAAMYDTLKIGIDMSTETLRERIEARLHARLRRGMLAEARRLHAQGLSWKRMEELGLEYRYMAKYLKGEISKEEMITELTHKIWQYAKRQRTWFKRDKDIQWFTPKETAKIEKMMSSFLAL